MGLGVLGQLAQWPWCTVELVVELPCLFRTGQSWWENHSGLHANGVLKRWGWASGSRLLSLDQQHRLPRCWGYSGYCKRSLGLNNIQGLPEWMMPGGSWGQKWKALMFKKEEVDKPAQKVAEAIGEDLLTYTPKMSKTMEWRTKVTLVRTIQGTTLVWLLLIQLQTNSGNQFCLEYLSSIIASLISNFHL